MLWQQQRVSLMQYEVSGILKITCSAGLDKVFEGFRKIYKAKG